jgi:LysM repeat protein
MTRARRAISAILLTVASGALAVVDSANAAPLSPASPVAAPLTYTVQAGDYLVGIASRMGVKLSALLDTNKLTVTSLIYPGMQLLVPTGGVAPAPKTPAAGVAAAPAAPTAPLTYTVVAGDSLSGIASRMGVKMAALLTANTLTVTSVIHPGKQLLVPAGGSLPAAPAAASLPVTPAAPAAAPTSALQYVVRSGDYLTGIAPALGVKVADLLSVNKLTLTSVIYPGMKLTVPAGGKLPEVAAPAATPVVVPSATGSNPDPRIATVIAFVKAQLGEPYKAFAAGPDSWDCSGLTMAAYAEIGISLQHYSGSQITKGVAVDRTTQPIVAGDLIFLESSVGSGIVSHVGIAISGTQWIHAPRTGDVVRIGNIPTTRVIGIRRLLPAT